VVLELLYGLVAAAPGPLAYLIRGAGEGAILQ